MDTDTRFTILPFPQDYDGVDGIRVRIVVIPRNQNPLAPATEPVTAGVVPFAEANWVFEAGILSGLAAFPYDQLPHDTRPLPTVAPPNAKVLFEALAKNFKITNPNRPNGSIEPPKKPAKLRPMPNSVKKYLPVTYRTAFNFTSPRTENAVTDDSYRCAVRDAGLVPTFQRDNDLVSWGKVFAFALRQTRLAEQLGMIYETTLRINDTHFSKGGYLYVDPANGSDYQARQQANPNFIKRYAARIPPLKLGEPRLLFAPILFPVLFKPNPAAVDPPIPTGYDELFVEAAEYDDGFAKIVHAHQPPSRNLLEETSDGAYPVKDVGIRLGWDDEQILIWYIRQMTAGDKPGERIDAPLGVFGYAIDVRETVLTDIDPVNPWISLNAVSTNNQPLTLKANGDETELGPFADDLPYQVYPSQLDGDDTKTYWLPMYFANWNGKSMVLPDTEAARVYRNNEKHKAMPVRTGVREDPVTNESTNVYSPVGLDNLELMYGTQYDFRVRLRDLSGGGVSAGDDFVRNTGSNIGTCRFRRYVAPSQPRVKTDPPSPPNDDTIQKLDRLLIRRPLLGYPAVKYTGGYGIEAVPRLILAANSSEFTGKGHAFGIPDTDVNRVQITVEVQTLRMDNLLSVSGKENYINLYTTNCSFPPVNNLDDFDDELAIPIVYRDCKVLRTSENDKNLTADLGLPANFTNMNQIVLPTARTVRLTIRAVCEDKPRNEDYYGLLNEDKNKDVRYGPIIQMMTFASSRNEEDLFLDTPSVPRLQGIFLQPDPPQLFDGTAKGLLLGRPVQKPPDIVERLAKQLDLDAAKGLTLTGRRGERVLFGCSNRIRHMLSPENSSITFSSKGDLMNHWLCCFSVQLNRDWMWDGLEDQAFIITRDKKFTHDKLTEAENDEEVGDIEIRRTAPFEALENAKRNYTRLVFIDAVEPKNHRLQDPPQPPPATPLPPKVRFPDTIEVNYTVTTRFKPGLGQDRDGVEEQKCILPITTPPSQVPKIVSVGVAMSPYERNDNYSESYPRRRYLWVEFAEPIEDPNDHYFARVLAYAPDQLISDNRPELFVAPEEPPLPIDPEYIRFVRDGATNDLAGLSAMQPMKRATDSKRHYLLPMPEKLHSNADELFGFFTYEFRVGHYKDTSTPEEHDMAWCTAQGRFGRPLRVTGIQHPAPQLTCMVDRDEEKITVSAPFAVAVANGKNVTADPPRTSLWCLLYAQVRQADNADFRNILLDNKHLDWRVQVEHNPNVNWFALYSKQQRQTLKQLNVFNWNDEIDFGLRSHVLKLTNLTTVNKDSTKYGTAVWSNNEAAQLLQAYGLPEDSPLSVLVVEFLPTITNYSDHVRQPGRKDMRDLILRLQDEVFRGKSDLISIPDAFLEPRDVEPAPERGPSPVDEALGQKRILRTSPLTEVPFVCCTNC